MHFIISIILAIIFSWFAVIYKDKRYNKPEKFNLISPIKRNIRFTIFSLASYIILAILSVVMFMKFPIGIESMYRWDVLIYICLLISYVDKREHLIPNLLIIILLGIRILFLIYEAIQCKDLLNMVFISPLVGMLIGGGILAVAMLISRKSIGMGDVKLFAIVGLYVGSQYIIPVLFLTFLFSAIYGIVLMVIKKAKFKDSIPMAPFATLGSAIFFFLTYFA